MLWNVSWHMCVLCLFLNFFLQITIYKNYIVINFFSSLWYLIFEITIIVVIIKNPIIIYPKLYEFFDSNCLKSSLILIGTIGAIFFISFCTHKNPIISLIFSSISISINTFFTLLLIFNKDLSLLISLYFNILSFISLKSILLLSLTFLNFNKYCLNELILFNKFSLYISLSISLLIKLFTTNLFVFWYDNNSVAFNNGCNILYSIKQFLFIL